MPGPETDRPKHDAERDESAEIERRNQEALAYRYSQAMAEKAAMMEKAGQNVG